MIEKVLSNDISFKIQKCLKEKLWKWATCLEKFGKGNTTPTYYSFYLKQKLSELACCQLWLNKMALLWGILIKFHTHKRAYILYRLL